MVEPRVTGRHCCFVVVVVAAAAAAVLVWNGRTGHAGVGSQVNGSSPSSTSSIDYRPPVESKLRCVEIEMGSHQPTATSSISDEFSLGGRRRR